jgi:hypothetical protein
MVIYQTTNLITNKKYIGKDKNNNPNYIGSGVDLKIAIKEYGKHNFKKEIIEYCSNIEHLIKQETYWLNYYDVENNPNFYNKTNKPFGNSGLSEETKQKIKQGLINRVWDQEWGKLSGQARTGSKRSIKNGSEHKNTGKIRTEEYKAKMSSIRIGKKHSLDWCSNIKNSRQGCIEAKSKPIQQINKGTIVKEYKSITEARNTTGIKGIKNVLTGLAKTAGGFEWKYIN